MKSSPILTVARIGIVVLIAALPLSARGSSAIGPRVGMNLDSDKFILGAQAELGRFLQTARFAPSLDLELGDNTTTAMNFDLRWYLIRLPETGLFFYGSAGPTIVLGSPGKGDSQTEIGLSLVAGVKIPMKGKNRYNLETRFGFGDIPDLKVMFGILFGI
jgi:hypothetical protein